MTRDSRAWRRRPPQQRHRPSVSQALRESDETARRALGRVLRRSVARRVRPWHGGQAVARVSNSGYTMSPWMTRSACTLLHPISPHGVMDRMG